jgi:hypothetical protein
MLAHSSVNGQCANYLTKPLVWQELFPDSLLVQGCSIPLGSIALIENLWPISLLGYEDQLVVPLPLTFDKTFGIPHQLRTSKATSSLSLGPDAQDAVVPEGAAHQL